MLLFLRVIISYWGQLFVLVVEIVGAFQLGHVCLLRSTKLRHCIGMNVLKLGVAGHHLICLSEIVSEVLEVLGLEVPLNPLTFGIFKILLAFSISRSHSFMYRRIPHFLFQFIWRLGEAAWRAVLSHAEVTLVVYLRFCRWRFWPVFDISTFFYMAFSGFFVKFTGAMGTLDQIMTRRRNLIGKTANLVLQFRIVIEIRIFLETVDLLAEADSLNEIFAFLFPFWYFLGGVFVGVV